MFLNVVSWNTNGEDARKSDRLKTVLDYLDAKENWRADIVFIQEANSGLRGDVYNYLAGCGRFPSVGRQSEAGGQGRSYLAAVGARVQLTYPFEKRELSADGQLEKWINSSFRKDIAETFLQELTNFRNLGWLRIRVPDSQGWKHVNLATWHAPRGNSLIGTSPNKLKGGASPDAYLALEHSGFYQSELLHLSRGDAAVLVGDLNIDRAHLGDRVVLPDGRTWEVLKQWRGAGFKLDSLLGVYTTRGSIRNSFDFDPEGTSDHNIIGGTCNWTGS